MDFQVVNHPAQDHVDLGPPTPAFLRPLLLILTDDGGKADRGDEALLRQIEAEKSCCRKGVCHLTHICYPDLHTDIRHIRDHVS